MKGKGFTLVELLAVIVILAIILTITVPGISGIIYTSTKNAFASDTKMVLTAINYKIMEDGTFNPITVNETNIKALLNLDDSNYQTVTVKKIYDTLHVTVVGKGKWNNLTASGTTAVSNVTDTVTAFNNGANRPVLVTGMTPVKWNGSSWVDTTENDSSWYNYDTTAKQWANARTADGSMWVWIPRYIYKISTGWHTSTAGTIDIQFTKGVDDNWNKAVIGNIDVGETANASNNKWTNHLAFTFGDTELTGFWVAKFEASNDGSSNVKIVPNVSSWRSISINDIFTKARSMETSNVYGWGTSGSNIDTHMVKNTEWGAVAYLSKSTYGKNAEIWINNSNNFTTGCAGDSVSDAVSTTGCEYSYSTSNGLQASTTGNIYGIYDMSGGSWEYTAAYINNGSTNLSLNGSSVLNANIKYKNVYTAGATDNDSNNYALAINSKGDALYETSTLGSGSTAWYNDYTNMPKTDGPWFIRSGYCSEGSTTGAYYFWNSQGVSFMWYGFRPIVSVGTGL